MAVELDELESLWPSYRGAFLLHVAQQSQGRVTNANIAVVAGHVALSLEVHRPTPAALKEALGSRAGDSAKSTSGGALPATSEAAAAAAAAAAVPSTAQTPRLRLTALLDVVPEDAPKPGIQQLARFLRRMLEASEGSSTGPGGNVDNRRGAEDGEGDDEMGNGSTHAGGLLGEDVPELLVIENIEKVVASEFLGLEKTTVGMQPAGLVYACIEADGLLRLWKWEAEGFGWRWTFLDEHNLCACRENSRGSRLLTATIRPDPERPRRGGSRYRIVWEQEDTGEGAGLGLALLPTGPGACRRVWSRRITFEFDTNGGGDGDGDGSTSDEEAGRLKDNGHLQIALGFSVSLLPTGVDVLLCSRLGAWMVTAGRITFNHFSTGWLPEILLPPLCLENEAAPRRNNNHGSECFSADGESDESEAFTDLESDPEGDPTPHQPVNNNTELADQAVLKNSELGPWDEDAKIFPFQRLFAVHNTTGDLMIFDPPGTIRAVSFPAGGGSLSMSLQCTLDPPPSVSPYALIVRLNQAVFVAGGTCSAYDLCTGQLLGKANVPRCRACAVRRKHKSAGRYLGLRCTCGRRRRRREGTEADSHRRAEQHQALWVSRTRGHLVGMRTETRVLRIRLPRTEASVQAFLASKRGNVPSAPRILQHVQEYRRFVGGGKARTDSLLPDLFKLLAARNADAGKKSSEASAAGVRMIDVLAHAFSQEKRCGQPNVANPWGSVPPWLLLAMTSAVQNERKQDFTPKGFGPTGIEGDFCGRDGDPVTTAAELSLRKSLEGRVADSLRSLKAVRALLREPATSSRMVPRAGVVADDETTDDLSLLTSEVDPGTALFESTLRSWLNCRRGEESKREPQQGWFMDGVDVKRGCNGGGFGGIGAEDGVALAFRCEAAGEAEAKRIPFLRFLLGGSNADTVATGSGIGRTRQETEFLEECTSSTFLCLHLAGNDKSPLFEVACRALFRLRPGQLPRFVERLARFRTYADEMKAAIDVAAVGDDATAGGDVDGEGDAITANDGHRSPAGTTSDLEGDGGDDVNSFKRGISARRGSNSTATSRRDLSPTSIDNRDEASSSVRSLSPGSRSRKFTWEDHSAHGSLPAGDTIDRASRHGKSGASSIREHSPESAVLSGPSVSTDSVPPSLNENLTSSALPAPSPSPPQSTQSTTAQDYFTRALSCLPPATKDERDGAQRRARLSLLLGARMFTEACKLLRARAWQGSASSGGVSRRRGSWRRDRAANSAWAAAIRLLGELKRGVNGEGETATYRPNSGALTAGDPIADDSQGVNSTLTAVYGGLGIQYHLAFQDALAETILEDAPDRMEMVMRYRPTDLTPIVVVRIVRRAAAEAAAATDCPFAGVTAWDNGSAMESPLSAGHAQLRTEPLAGSTTQTLKTCLLLLVEEDRNKEGA